MAADYMPPDTDVEASLQRHVDEVDIWTKRVKKKKKQYFDSIGFSPDAAKRQEAELRLHGLNKFYFLVVIAGCELDLYGYLFTILSHWRECPHDLGAQWIGRVFVIIGLVGYFGAASLGYFGFMPEDETAERTHTTIKLYHFMPILRFFLIIKDQEANDVEALFRVNALSTFTLGLSVMVNLMLQHSCGDPWTFFRTVNLATQLLNLCITVKYFSSDINTKMQNATKVDAALYNQDRHSRKDFKDYIHLVQKVAKDQSEKNSLELTEQDEKIQKKLRMAFGHLEVDWKIFPRSELLKLLRFASFKDLQQQVR